MRVTLVALAASALLAGACGTPSATVAEPASTSLTPASATDASLSPAAPVAGERGSLSCADFFEPEVADLLLGADAAHVVGTQGTVVDGNLRCKWTPDSTPFSEVEVQATTDFALWDSKWDGAGVTNVGDVAKVYARWEASSHVRFAVFQDGHGFDIGISYYHERSDLGAADVVAIIRREIDRHMPIGTTDPLEIAKMTCPSASVVADRVGTSVTATDDQMPSHCGYNGDALQFQIVSIARSLGPFWGSPTGRFSGMRINARDDLAAGAFVAEGDNRDCSAAAGEIVVVVLGDGWSRDRCDIAADVLTLALANPADAAPDA